MELSFRDFKFSEIIKYVKEWTWQEIDFGYQQSIISKEEVIEFAGNSLNANLVEDMLNIDMVIAIAIKDPYDSIDNDLQFLCNNEEKQEEKEIKSKWLYALLNILFEKKEQVKNVQYLIDGLYSDFGYPEEISYLISYMPYDGDMGLSIEERWERYLMKGSKKYCYLK